MWKWWAGLLFIVGTLHAAAYALLVPPWQAPDEPGHIEYACLLAERGHLAPAGDRSPALEQEIILSLARHDFWPRVREAWPDPLPPSFAADPFLARSGRQVGDEPPLYYLIPALVCRAALPLETRLRLIRLLGALLFGLTGLVISWGWSSPQLKIPHSPFTINHFPPFGILHSAFCILLPMPAFISGSANNDSLAILTASAVFAATLRIQRIGWSWRRGLGLLALLALALLSKKINLFLLPWLAFLALANGWRWLAPRPRARLIGLAGLTLLLLALLLPSNAPATWRGNRQPLGQGRVAASPAQGQAVQIVDASPGDFGRLYQHLAGPEIKALAGRPVEATLQVRSLDGQPQPGRLTLRDAAGYSQTRFTATRDWQTVSLTRTVAITSPYLKLAVAPGPGLDAAETGELLIDNASLHAPPDGPNLLRNASFERPARWGELLITASLEQRWQQFAPPLLARETWSARSLQRYGLYIALTFAGFWGNFGWLQHPLPVWLYGLIAMLCLLSVVGLGRRRIQNSEFRIQNSEVRSPESGSGRVWHFPSGIPNSQFTIHNSQLNAWLLAVALIALQTFLPMLGRDWQPQGRYLFPALFPITGLLLVGLMAWFEKTGTRHSSEESGQTTA